MKIGKDEIGVKGTIALVMIPILSYVLVMMLFATIIGFIIVFAMLALSFSVYYGDLQSHREARKEAENKAKST